MIGNESFSRRTSSYDNLFSLQGIRIPRGSPAVDSSSTAAILLPSNHKLHQGEPQLHSDLATFEPRSRLPSSNSVQGNRTRELSSLTGPTASANKDLTSIWGPMEAMMINGNTQRTRSCSQDPGGVPHFSEKFLLTEEHSDPIQKRPFNRSDSEPAELSRIIAPHFTQPKSNTGTLDIPFDSRKVNTALQNLPSSNHPSSTTSSSNWMQGHHQMSRTQYNVPPVPTGALKKSASMASLPFVERGYDHPFPAASNLTSMPSAESHQRASDYANFRSAVSAPHSREPTASSDFASTTGIPICRYFLQGYCSRGSRCFYSHSTKPTNIHPTFHQPPQSSTPSTLPPNAHIRNLSVPIGLHAHHHPHHPTVVLPSFDHQHQFNPPHLPPFLAVEPRFSGVKSHQPPAPKKSDEEANRYANVNIEDLGGQYYAMCKDQFGCRYLQKQIEESPSKSISLIFKDVFEHLGELMTDPFGNYLCQKLLEFCDEAQKGMIVARVGPQLVTISLNMHGTRAVQKLIENVTDQKQVKAITSALSTDAVKLIKDLNGNHVIQKCLSKLSPTMNQFVFDAVSATIIEVATHRHGCCVLQRCIDHAVDSQKLQLVQEIAANGLALVQDPFGNYVVQYVLDLEDERYSSFIVRPFIGNVCLLSIQKFSSNVIEKCIRVSKPSLRRQLIEELLDRSRLESLLRDSYANYVVQTALDYADAEQKLKLIECIKPILPVIRTTPYGKRLQTKISTSETQ